MICLKTTGRLRNRIWSIFNQKYESVDTILDTSIMTKLANCQPMISQIYHVPKLHHIRQFLFKTRHFLVNTLKALRKDKTKALTIWASKIDKSVQKWPQSG